MSDLFEAGGLPDDAPRPLADRLRPKMLGEVIGQDHLIGITRERFIVIPQHQRDGNRGAQKHRAAPIELLPDIVGTVLLRLFRPTVLRGKNRRG